MAKDNFQEFHHGEKEYCRESGPLKYKAIGFPSATAVVNGLELVAAGIAVAAVVVLSIAFSFASRLFYVGYNDAVVEVNIKGRPDDVIIEYVLTKASEDNAIYTGELENGQDRIDFRSLTENTGYVVKFYRSDNGDKLGETYFTTLGRSENPQEPPQTDPPVIDPPDTVPPENNSPANEQPDNKQEDEQTPPDNAQTEPPSATGAELVSAGKVFDSGENFVGYICTETHSFENVENNEFTVDITHMGQAVTDYDVEYDENSKTVRVTFVGTVIPLGESGQSSVRIANEYGSCVSEKVITTPELGDMTLEIISNGNGEFTYHITGDVTLPSEGTVDIEGILYPDMNGVSSDNGFTEERTFTVKGTSATYSSSFSASLDEPGLVLEALAYVESLWSFDDGESAYAEFSEDTVEYVCDGIRFMNYRGPRGDIRYDVEATFLTPGIASVENTEFVWELLPFDTEFGSSGSTYATDIFEATSVEFDSQTGYAKAVFKVSDEYNSFGMGLNALGDEYRWTVNLEYTDSAGAVVKTPDCIAKISYPYAIIADMRSVSYRIGESVYVDFTYERTFNTFYDGELFVSESNIYITPVTWTFVGSPTISVNGNTVTISGTIVGAEPVDTGLQINCDWMVDGQLLEVGYIGSSITTSVFPAEPTVTYDEQADQYVEKHRFENVEENYSYHNYVSISTADGNEYTVIYDEQAVTTDPTGCVSVEWLDESGDTVVTVRRNGASAGDETVVRHYMWDELNYARSTFAYEISDIK